MINADFEPQGRLREDMLAVLSGALKQVHENGIAMVDYFGVRSNAPDFSLGDLRTALGFYLRRKSGAPPPGPIEILAPAQEAAFRVLCEKLIEQRALEPVFSEYSHTRFRVRLVPEPFSQRWQFITQLGGGGQSATAQVRRKSDGALGVLKLLKPASTSEKSAVAKERFRHEVESLKLINHPAVVKLLDHNLDDSGSCELGYVTSYGSPLENYWNEAALLFTPTQLFDRAYEIVRVIAEGLIEVHGQGLIHRDLKPDNVIIYDEQPVIIDFGLVTHAKYRAKNLTVLDGQQVGNHFNPPVVYALKDDDPRCDIAGLGWLYGFLLGEAVGGKRRPQRFHWQFHDMVEEPRRERVRAILAACSQIESIPRCAREFVELIDQYRLGGVPNHGPAKSDTVAISLAQAALAESRARESLRQLRQKERIEAEIKMLESPLSRLREALFAVSANIRENGKLPVFLLSRSHPLATPLIFTENDYVKTADRNASMADLLRLVPDRPANGICFFACKGDVPGRPFHICAAVVFSRAEISDGTKLRLQLWRHATDGQENKFQAYRLVSSGRFRNEETKNEENIEEISAMVADWIVDPACWSPA